MSSSNNSITHSGVVRETNNENKGDGLINLLDSVISMMCLASNTNPYQVRKAAMLIYIGARVCIEIARTATPTKLTANVIIVAIVIAVETALWIISGHLLGFSILSVALLLVALICYYDSIWKLLKACFGKLFGQKRSNTCVLIKHEGTYEDAQVLEFKENQAL